MGNGKVQLQNSCPWHASFFQLATRGPCSIEDESSAERFSRHVRSNAPRLRKLYEQFSGKRKDMLGGGSWTSDLERCQDAAHAPEKLRLPKIESIWINLDCMFHKPYIQLLHCINKRRFVLAVTVVLLSNSYDSFSLFLGWTLQYVSPQQRMKSSHLVWTQRRIWIYYLYLFVDLDHRKILGKSLIPLVAERRLRSSALQVCWRAWHWSTRVIITAALMTVAILPGHISET